MKAGIFLLGLLFSLTAHAQFPSKPVRIIVPYEHVRMDIDDFHREIFFNAFS